MIAGNQMIVPATWLLPAMNGSIAMSEDKTNARTQEHRGTILIREPAGTIMETPNPIQPTPRPRKSAVVSVCVGGADLVYQE
jgi:hypothetical protein